MDPGYKFLKERLVKISNGSLAPSQAGCLIQEIKTTATCCLTLILHLCHLCDLWLSSPLREGYRKGSCRYHLAQSPQHLFPVAVWASKNFLKNIEPKSHPTCFMLSMAWYFFYIVLWGSDRVLQILQGPKWKSTQGRPASTFALDLRCWSRKQRSECHRNCVNSGFPWRIEQWMIWVAPCS